MEQLRLIVNELQMMPVRSAVHIQGGDFMAVQSGDKNRRLGLYAAFGDDDAGRLAWWAKSLKTAREQG